MNTMFSHCDPKIRNMKTHILLAIIFHICGHEDTSVKIYSHLGVYISESFSLQPQITDQRTQYEIFYKKNTCVNIMRYQMLQNKIRDKKLKQYKEEMKVYFYGNGCDLDPIF